MATRESSSEDSLFSPSSTSSSTITQFHGDQGDQPALQKPSTNGAHNVQHERTRTKNGGDGDIENHPTSNSDLKNVGAPKPKKQLLKLLNDAYKYSSYVEYSLPTSFLRSRAKPTNTNDDQVQINDVSSKDVDNRRKRAANGKGRGNKKLGIKDVRGAETQNHKPKYTSSNNITAKERKRRKGIQELNSKEGRKKKLHLSDEEILRTAEPVTEKAVQEQQDVDEPTLTDQTSEMIPLLYDLFDFEYLEKTTKYDGTIRPSTVLDHHHHVNAERVRLKSILFPDYEEEYVVDFRADYSKYNPMLEIAKLIENTVRVYLPAKYFENARKTIVKPLNTSFDNADQETFINCVVAYNEFVSKLSRQEILEHLKTVREVPRAFFHDLLHIVYTRVIHPQVGKLRNYEAFSNYVYGELLPNFLSKVYTQCGLKPDHIFMDLGSGVGNCVIQAALEFGCTLSFGCEIMPNASLLTEAQCEELKQRCRLLGLNLPPLEFSLRKSFIDNKRVNELLAKCDVLLVNNFIFDAEMNKHVESIIQNLKPGCKIITLKNLRPRGYTINFDDVGNILNRLRVQRFDLEEESVSWTHRGGEYFISTVEVDIDESIFTTYSKGRVRTNKRVKYTR